VVSGAAGPDRQDSSTGLNSSLLLRRATVLGGGCISET